MCREGLGNNMSLNRAIKELDDVIDWLFVCGAMKSMGINCVVAKSTRATYVSTKSMGANCAYDKETTINEGRLLESSTRLGTCTIVETMLSRATNGVRVLVIPKTPLVKCCCDELGMTNEYLSLYV
jgi:hypothetical protein